MFSALQSVRTFRTIISIYTKIRLEIYLSLHLTREQSITHSSLLIKKSHLASNIHPKPCTCPQNRLQKINQSYIEISFIFGLEQKTVFRSVSLQFVIIYWYITRHPKSPQINVMVIYLTFTLTPAHRKDSLVKNNYWLSKNLPRALSSLHYYLQFFNLPLLFPKMKTSPRCNYHFIPNGPILHSKADIINRNIPLLLGLGSMCKHGLTNSFNKGILAYDNFTWTLPIHFQNEQAFIL